MSRELLPVKTPSKDSVIHDYLEYFSASFLARMNFPGLPGSRAGIYNTANREEWKFIVVPGKGKRDGVRYYRVPDYVRDLILEWREHVKKSELDRSQQFDDVFGAAHPAETPATPTSQSAARYMAAPALASAENKVRDNSAIYMAGVAASKEPGMGAMIDESLLSACLDACRIVYGDAFSTSPALEQLGFAVDLYNLLVKISAQNGGIEQMKRLEINGLVEQLKLFKQLGWARKFLPPPPENSSSFF